MGIDLCSSVPDSRNSTLLGKDVGGLGPNVRSDLPNMPNRAKSYSPIFRYLENVG